jgi:hypothetical protein
VSFVKQIFVTQWVIFNKTHEKKSHTNAQKTFDRHSDPETNTSWAQENMVLK